jgi:hypothetical protein
VLSHDASLRMSMTTAAYVKNGIAHVTDQNSHAPTLLATPLDGLPCGTAPLRYGSLLLAIVRIVPQYYDMNQRLVLCGTSQTVARTAILGSFFLHHEGVRKRTDFLGDFRGVRTVLQWL